ncbi:hypothetical protein KKF34_19945 [Myxococcota bacterium]|nr:hypothetical protein [Myxococcota bacterium]MBU1380864.1 hypothetical protein [Myxococcota bacterium]MBU1499161.1 hypothetical protein [Myxococcota bacterium]
MNAFFRKILIFLDRYAISGLSLILLAGAGWYTLGVLKITENNKKKLCSLKSGDKVTITGISGLHNITVIDRMNKNKSTGLAGVFIPDPGDVFIEFKKGSKEYLEKNFLNKDCMIFFEQLPKSDFVPVRLECILNGKKRDITLELIELGFALYNPSLHSKKSIRYLDSEYKARLGRRGIWGNQKATDAAVIFKNRWKKEEP